MKSSMKIRDKKENQDAIKLALMILPTTMLLFGFSIGMMLISVEFNITNLWYLPCLFVLVFLTWFNIHHIKKVDDI